MLLKKLLIVLIFLALLDQAGGLLLHFLFSHQQVSSEADTVYAVKKAKEDIIILGTSRANRNYDAPLIADSLHLSCFNAGHDAQSIFYDWMMIRLICKRYYPKCFLIDISPSELYETNDETDRFYQLLPYAHEYDEADFILDLKDERDRNKNYWGNQLLCFNTERIKMLSGIYPYNSFIIQLCVAQQKATKNLSGWDPLDEQLTFQRFEMIRRQQNKKNSSCITLDQDKISCLLKIIRFTKSEKINLVFCVSPELIPEPYIAARNILNAICKENKVPLMDFSNNIGLTDMSYFRDLHLNTKGATIFSSEVAEELKKILLPADSVVQSN